MRLINLLWQNWSFSPPNHWTLWITLTYHYSFTRNYTGRKGKTELQRNPFGKILLTLDWLMWVLWPSSLSHFAVAHITHEEIFHISGSWDLCKRSSMRPLAITTLSHLVNVINQKKEFLHLSLPGVFWVNACSCHHSALAN
jgi:hypothetical protein